MLPREVATFSLLARKGSFDMTSQPQLKRAWVNEGLVAADENRAARRRQQRKDHPISRGWKWLRINGSAISAIGVLLGLVSGVIWGISQGTKILIRLENLGESVDGKNGLKMQVGSLRDSVTKLDAGR